MSKKPLLILAAAALLASCGVENPPQTTESSVSSEPTTSSESEVSSDSETPDEPDELETFLKSLADENFTVVDDEAYSRMFFVGPKEMIYDVQSSSSTAEEPDYDTYVVAGTEQGLISFTWNGSSVGLDEILSASTAAEISDYYASPVLLSDTYDVWTKSAEEESKYATDNSYIGYVALSLAGYGNLGYYVYLGYYDCTVELALTEDGARLSADVLYNGATALTTYVDVTEIGATDGLASYNPIRPSYIAENVTLPSRSDWSAREAYVIEGVTGIDDLPFIGKETYGMQFKYETDSSGEYIDYIYFEDITCGDQLESYGALLENVGFKLDEEKYYTYDKEGEHSRMYVREAIPDDDDAQVGGLDNAVRVVYLEPEDELDPYGTFMIYPFSEGRTYTHEGETLADVNERLTSIKKSDGTTALPEIPVLKDETETEVELTFTYINERTLEYVESLVYFDLIAQIDDEALADEFIEQYAALFTEEDGFEVDGEDGYYEIVLEDEAFHPEVNLNVWIVKDLDDDEAYTGKVMIVVKTLLVGTTAEEGE